MPKYRVRLAARSGLRVITGRNFSGPDHRVRVTDALDSSKDSGNEQHTGLLFTVDVNAPKIEDSFNAAIAHARAIADLLSATHSTAISELYPMFAIDWDPAHNDREIATYSRSLPALREVRREFDHDNLTAVFTALNKLRKTDTKIAMRVDRALHFLRRAGNETDPIDLYEDLGDGLQAIDDPLRKKHVTATTFQKRCPNKECAQLLRCADCGTSIDSQDQFAGTDWVIEKKLGLGKTAAKGVRATRNKIVHQFKSFAQVAADLPAATSTARKALIAGIADLLSLPASVEAAMQRAFLSVVVEAPSIIVIGVVYDRPLDTIGASANYPVLAIRGARMLVPQKPGVGQESLLHAVTLQVGIDNNDGFDWELRSAQVSVPTDPEDNSPLPQLLLEQV